MELVVSLFMEDHLMVSTRKSHIDIIIYIKNIYLII